MEDVAPIEAKVCANIGPKERALRVWVGVVSTGITLLAIGGVLEAHAPCWGRALIALPAFTAAMGFFQASNQTCVAFARRNLIVLGDRKDAVKVDSEKMKEQIARQARKVYLQASILTAVIVAVVLAIP